MRRLAGQPSLVADSESDGDDKSGAVMPVRAPLTAGPSSTVVVDQSSSIANGV
jgi:small neutral amino acid transporter SnatA (MarC family)